MILCLTNAPSFRDTRYFRHDSDAISACRCALAGVGAMATMRHQQTFRSSLIFDWLGPENEPAAREGVCG
ncbi:UNVERIFIED_ORG: hypothetical protein J2W85_006248 [Ensifer adhaerens]|nr:hypothetical protein [Ensifer adhaerens]